MKKPMFKYIVFALLFCSCLTEKRRLEICKSCPSKTERHDSIIIKTVLHDTTIFISQPGEPIYIPNPCAELCDSLYQLKQSFKPIVRKHNGLVTTIKVVNGSLVAHCAADSLKAVIRGLNKTIKETRISTEVGTIENKVHFVTQWESFLIVSAKILWVLVLVLLGWKAFKYYRKFHLPLP